MTAEHRAAPGLNDIEVELADHGQGPAMRLCRAGPAEAAPEPETPEQRIVQTLADAETPLIREHRVECAPGGGYRLAGAGKHRQDPLPKTVTASNP